MTRPDADGWSTVEWTMDQMDTDAMAKQSLRWFLVGGLAFAVFAIRPVLVHDPYSSWWNLIPFIGLFIVGVVVSAVVHEAMHGIVMARYGARPKFGVGMMQDKVPYAYATSPGHKYTRRQFWWVLMMPTIVVNPMFAVLILLLPWGPYLWLPAALHLSGCVGDWLIWRMVAEQPEGTLIEDTRQGVIMHIPPQTMPRPETGA